VPDTATTALKERIEAIEGGYEYFLSYAAKGYRGDPGVGGEIRDCLTRMQQALDGLGEFLTGLARGRGLEPLPPYEAFAALLERDASRAKVAIELVMAQPGISSQVIDNLNGSIHLRAVLTDLFLVDEILRPRASNAIPAKALAGEAPPPSGASS
jgi:hypothetical protein